jgi:hypothetical protein
MDKYKVTLTKDERQQLEAMVNKGKAAARKLTHARVLLLADESENRKGTLDAPIAAGLQINLRTVARVRQRFVLESFEAAVQPRRQPPRPDKLKLDPEGERQLVELACSDPPRGRCGWTLQLLAEQLVLLRVTSAISREVVRRCLKKTTFDSVW